MKARLLSVLCALAVTCLASRCSATVIDIDNPDFDNDGSLAGWDALGAAGVWGGDATLSPYSPPYMAYINSGGFSGQPLEIGGSPLVANAGDQITISPYLKACAPTKRPMRTLRSSCVRRIQAPLSRRRRLATPLLAAGWGADFSYTLTAADAGAEGTNVFLWLANPTPTPRQVAVDNVSASYTPASPAAPEPSTLVLLATGLIGSLAYAWRKRK